MKRKLLILTAVLLAAVLPVAALAGGLTFATTTLNGKSYTSEEIKNYKLTMVNVWAESPHIRSIMLFSLNPGKTSLSMILLFIRSRRIWCR